MPTTLLTRAPIDNPMFTGIVGAANIYQGVATYESAAAPTNGLLISTLIPFVPNTELLVFVKGHLFTSKTDFDARIALAPSGNTSTGNFTGSVTMAGGKALAVQVGVDTSGNICIFLPVTEGARLYVDAMSGVDPALLVGWVVTDDPCPTTLLTAFSAAGAQVGVADDTTTNATYYPTFVSAVSGLASFKVSSTKLSFNPSTGVLKSAGMDVKSQTPDGATAFALRVDTSATWANTSARLLSVKNNGTEKAYINKDGEVYTGANKHWHAGNLTPSTLSTAGSIAQRDASAWLTAALFNVVSGSYMAQFTADATGAYLASSGATSLRFYTNAVERLNIGSTGDITAPGSFTADGGLTTAGFLTADGGIATEGDVSQGGHPVADQAGVFYVRRYGAMGDGINNDLPAFQAALAAAYAWAQQYATGAVTGSDFVPGAKVVTGSGRFRLVGHLDLTVGDPLGGGPTYFGLGRVTLEGMGRTNTQLIFDNGTATDGLAVGGYTTVSDMTIRGTARTMVKSITNAGTSNAGRSAERLYMRRVFITGTPDTANGYVSLDLPGAFWCTLDTVYAPYGAKFNGNSMNCYGVNLINCQIANYANNNVPSLTMRGTGFMIFGGMVFSVNPSTAPAILLEQGSMVVEGVDLAYTSVNSTTGYDIVVGGGAGFASAQANVVGCNLPLRNHTVGVSGNMLVRSNVVGGEISNNIYLGTPSIDIEAGATGMSFTDANLPVSALNYNNGAAIDTYPGRIAIRDFDLTCAANDTTTNATYYPTFMSAASGLGALKVASSKLSFNPSTGLLGSSRLALTGTVDTVPLSINAPTGQTAKLQSWQVNGAEKAYLTADGALVAPVQPLSVDLGSVSGDVTIDIGKADYYSLHIDDAYTKINFTNSVLSSGPKAIQLRIENGLYTYPVTYDSTKTLNCSSAGYFLKYIGGVVRIVNAPNTGVGSAGVDTPDFLTWTPRPTTQASLAATISRAQVANGIHFLLHSTTAAGSPVKYSTDDGATWSPAVSHFHGYFQSIIWDGTRYVGLVYYNYAYYIYTSTSLPNWTRLAVLPYVASMAYYDIAWNGSMYVVVTGGASSASVYTSPDGITWTVRTTTGSTSLTRVIWAGSRWVAVGATGKVFTSPDGITWTVQTGLGTIAFTGLFYVNGHIYIATMTTATAYVSANGTTWTAKVSPITTVTDLLWTGSVYVMLCLNGQVLTTPDLVNTAWTETGVGNLTPFVMKTSGGTIFAYSPSTAVGGVYVTQRSLDDGATWKRILPVNNGAGPCSVMLEKSGTVIAVSQGGVYYSTDEGATWSLGTAWAASSGFSGIASVSSNLFLVFNSSSQPNYNFPTTGKMSRDGIAWTDLPYGGTVGAVTTWVAAAADEAGHVVIVGTQGMVLRSSNAGTDWTLGEMADWNGAPPSPLGVAWDSVGSQFIVWGQGQTGSASFMATSADFGATWTFFSTPSDLSVQNLVRYLRASDSHVFISSMNSECWFTPDFIYWNKQTIPFSYVSILSWDGTTVKASGNYMTGGGAPIVTLSPLRNGVHWGNSVRFAGGTRPAFTGLTYGPNPVDIFRVVYDPIFSSYVISALVSGVRL